MGVIWIYICILIPSTERFPKGGLRLIQVSLYGLLGGAEEVSALRDAVAFDLAKDIDASERKRQLLEAGFELASGGGDQRQTRAVVMMS